MNATVPQSFDSPGCREYRALAAAVDLAPLTADQRREVYVQSIYPRRDYGIAEVAGMTLEGTLDDSCRWVWTDARVGNVDEFRAIWGAPVTHERALQVMARLSDEHLAEAREQAEKWLDRQIDEAPRVRGKFYTDDMSDELIRMIYVRGGC